MVLAIGGVVWITNLGPASYEAAKHELVVATVVSQSEAARGECDTVVKTKSSQFAARLGYDGCSVYPGTSPGDAVQVEVWNGNATVLVARGASYTTKDHPGPYRDAGPLLMIGAACVAVAALAGTVAYLFRKF